MMTIFTTKMMIYGIALLVDTDIKSNCVCTGPTDSICMIDTYIDKRVDPKKKYIKIELRDQKSIPHLRVGEAHVQCMIQKAKK